MTTAEPNPARPAADSLVVAESVADAVDAGLPLAGGLRAAAAESLSRSVARGLERLAVRIERGEPLDRALAAEPLVLPETMRQVIRATAEQGRLHESLAQWCDQQRRQADLTRVIWAAILYPLIIIGMSLIVSLMVMVVSSRAFGPMIEEFELKVPNSSRVAVWLGGPGLGVVLAVPVAAVIAWALLRVGLGREQWNVLVSQIPMVGAIWYWMAVARWSRWLALLIESRVPLPRALEFAAPTAFDRRVAKESRRLAESTAGGQSLSRGLAESRVLPAMAAVLVRWGEQSASLASSWRDLAELCESRARARARWLRLAFPPLAFVFVAFAVIFAYTNFMLPIARLMQSFY